MLVIGLSSNVKTSRQNECCNLIMRDFGKRESLRWSVVGTHLEREKKRKKRELVCLFATKSLRYLQRSDSKQVVVIITKNDLIFQCHFVWFSSNIFRLLSLLLRKVQSAVIQSKLVYLNVIPIQIEGCRVLVTVVRLWARGVTFGLDHRSFSD